MEKLDPRSAAYSEVLNEIGELELVLHAQDVYKRQHLCKPSRKS